MVFSNFSFTGVKVIKPIEQSPDHDGFSERLPQVLMLADRILAACANTADRGQLPSRFEEVFTNFKTDTKEKVADTLLTKCLEPFLREVLHYGLPVDYGNLKSRGNNLFGIIVSLKMLTKEEADLEIEEENKIPDLVRKAAFRAKEARNPSSHTAASLSDSTSSNSIDDVLITILAAVDRHRDALRTNLEGLVVRNIEAGGQLPMLRMVEGERSKHLRLFKGRSTLISDISSRADKIRSGGGYILIMGPEGFGKSALASKLSEEFGRSVKIIGAFADATRRDCPWLPGVLLHLGKQGRDEDDIVRSLIDQANTCLLSKVSPPPMPKGNAEIDLDTSILDSESINDGESRSGRTRRISLSAGTRTNHDEVLRRALYLTLEQLAFEQGHVTFIVDSLDEISPSGTGLGFLPSPLPKNVVGVLTARNETKLVEALK
ncbi:MAG: AAA family ATPase, partial [Verrucomicrobiota bacterium]